MIQFRTKVSGCLLCAVLCLGLLAGCTGTEEPSVSEPGSETVSQLPEEFTKNIEEDGKERVAADYIACMTDRYAITDFCRLFVPREWV